MEQPKFKIGDQCIYSIWDGDEQFVLGLIEMAHTIKGVWHYSLVNIVLTEDKLTKWNFQQTQMKI